MSFNFGLPATTAGTPKTAATGFTLPTNPITTTPATGLQFNFASGDTKTQAKPSTLFPATTPSSQTLTFGSTPKPSNAPTSTPSFGLATPTTQSTAAPNLSFGAPANVTVSTTGSIPQFGLSTSKAGTTTLTNLLGSTPAATTTTAPAKLGFGTGLSAPTSTTTPASITGALFGTTSVASTTSAVPALGLSTTTPTTSAPASTALSTSIVAPTYSATALPTTGSITFAQLEDSINRWTIDLEEQGKFFINQAKQLNAWDSLLISNGEKILNLNSSVERVKQQQQQLDQELDFVLSQQKELEELIIPLEKELVDIPVTDIDRNQMYQFSEIIDSQLKQMSDDLKEIVEHINESNKDEETANPITQITRIMNAHMNSLQWLDRNTAQISSHLEQIGKIQDTNKRNFALNNSFNL